MGCIEFAKTINRITGLQPSTDCFNYGITYGCNIDCPVLIAGECELQENENKELYLEIKQLNKFA